MRKPVIEGHRVTRSAVLRAGCWRELTSGRQESGNHPQRNGDDHCATVTDLYIYGLGRTPDKHMCRRAQRDDPTHRSATIQLLHPATQWGYRLPGGLLEYQFRQGQPNRQANVDSTTFENWAETSAGAEIASTSTRCRLNTCRHLATDFFGGGYNQINGTGFLTRWLQGELLVRIRRPSEPLSRTTNKG